MLGGGRSSPIRPRGSRLGARTRAAASSRLRPGPGRPSLPLTPSASLSRSSTRCRSSSSLTKLCSPSGLRRSSPRSGRLNARILRVGAGFGAWRDVLRDWTAPDGRRVVLATIQTARSYAFRTGVTRKGRTCSSWLTRSIALAHPANRTLLDETLFGPRLGLSATPERAGDDVGTSAILDYFGGVLEPRYTLADAVRDRVLTPYFYRPRTVSLLETEMRRSGT